MGGFHPVNVISKSHVLFLASFDNNDAILSQFHVLTMLSESFIRTLTIVLPFFPMGTMERVTREGRPATVVKLSDQAFSGASNLGGGGGSEVGWIAQPRQAG